MAESPPPPRPAAPGPDPPALRPEDRGAYLNLPLWQRLAISLSVGAILLVGLVIWVSGHNTDSQPSNGNPAAAVRANHDAEILVAQDQAPHTTPLHPGIRPRTALEHAIQARMAAQVTSGAISGPLARAHCRPTGAGSTSVQGFSCTIESGTVIYPFLAAVDTAGRRITVCKRDPPPVPSETVPVSPRCRP